MAPLSESERDILEMACEANENVTLLKEDGEAPSVYKSRMLQFDPAAKTLIVDEPSADSPGARPLARGESIDVFFEVKTLRFIFSTQIAGHTTFRLRNREIRAMALGIPGALRDGERRDYFRVDAPKSPVIAVTFRIHKGGADRPVMSAVLEHAPELFETRLEDISGGGLAMSGRPAIDLDKGDLVAASFALRPEGPALEMWAEVRYRKTLPTGDSLWGVMFLSESRNPQLHAQRSRIMRYVIDRQRELLFK